MRICDVGQCLSCRCVSGANTRRLAAEYAITNGMREQGRALTKRIGRCRTLKNYSYLGLLFFGKNDLAEGVLLPTRHL